LQGQGSTVCLYIIFGTNMLCLTRILVVGRNFFDGTHKSLWNACHKVEPLMCKFLF